MIGIPDVDVYTKPHIARKHTEKRRKQQPSENQKKTKYRNIS